MQTRRTTIRDRDGNAAILALITLTLLAGLSMAQFSVARKQIEKSDFFLSRSELRRYAESGIATSYHNLKSNIDGGQIGTLSWDPASDDLGRDGIAATLDAGEGDGFPTPGEPSLVPVTVANGVLLIVHVSDTALPGVKRILASSFTERESVTLERQVRQLEFSIPRAGSVYVDAGVALNLNGNNFLIDGNDSNPDGSPGDDPALVGIATAPGAMDGVLAQIGGQQEDNILGLGGEPSVGEVAGVDIDALAAQFHAGPHQTVPAGTHTDVAWGDWDSGDMLTTYCAGDLHLSGEGGGAGVLIVDGDLTVSGEFEFAGIVVVTGDITMTGGGAGVHVWGTVFAQGALNPSMEVQGSAELHYSSGVLDALEQSVNAGYETVYYGERSY